jgi:gliding motility associated protien GldN
MRRIILVFLITLVIDSNAQSGGFSGFGGGFDSGDNQEQTKKDSKGKKGDGTNPPTPAAPEIPKPKIAPIALQYNNDTSYFNSLKANAQAHYEPEYMNQDTNLTVIEGQYIPRPYLRKADEKFRRRVWRVIDLRQKLNKSWTWPRAPITQVFWELATQGKVRAYAKDSLRRLITPEEITAKCGKLVEKRKLKPGVDPLNHDPDDDANFDIKMEYEAFDWSQIRKFEIMEDWIFDYKHGEMRPVIIAIAPIIENSVKVDGNDITSDMKPFWLKMDDCRPTLAKSQVFNRYNDAMRLNWDQHINGHRLFDSYIVRTSDQDDSYLKEKAEFSTDGTALLLESEKIKNDLFIFEHDLWEY